MTPRVFSMSNVADMGVMPSNMAQTRSCVLCLCQKLVSRAGTSNYIPQYSVGCNYLSLSLILASDTQVLVCFMCLCQKPVLRAGTSNYLPQYSVQYIPWNMLRALLCFGVCDYLMCTWWILSIYLHVFISIASLALEQWCCNRCRKIAPVSVT